jgi:hypothetical protein
MTAAQILDDDTPARRPWLMTLADLFMLLVGFFVFLQANEALDARQIGDGIRGAFGVVTDAPAMAADSAAIAGFAPGSALLPADTGAALAWARAASADPRTIVTVIGATDGSAADVDPATGSAAILAAARAGTAARALATVVPPGRLRIQTGSGGRSALLHLGFAGEPPVKDTQP